MANFKTCSNGHNYDADKYAVCPFCPGNSADPDYEKTMMDFKRTQMFEEGNSNQFNKTMISEDSQDFKKTQEGTVTPHPFSRTSIVMGNDKADAAPLQQSEKRKLVGWLVTFDHDEYGQDYKLYVGKNKIGSAPGSDILITDSTISGDHAVILFRDNEFLVKDNFSTNGTRINGVSIDEGKLKADDEIKLGNTSFKFKTVF